MNGPNGKKNGKPKTARKKTANRKGVQKQQNNNGLGGVTGKGWVPGQSGNPGGRPKGSSVASRIQRILAADDGKAAEALAKVFISQGIKADFKFAKEVIDRADGKVPDRIAGHDGGPLIREVQFELDRL